MSIHGNLYEHCCSMSSICVRTGLPTGVLPYRFAYKCKVTSVCAIFIACDGLMSTSFCAGFQIHHQRVSSKVPQRSCIIIPIQVLLQCCIISIRTILTYWVQRLEFALNSRGMRMNTSVVIVGSTGN